MEIFTKDFAMPSGMGKINPATRYPAGYICIPSEHPPVSTPLRKWY